MHGRETHEVRVPLSGQAELSGHAPCCIRYHDAHPRRRDRMVAVRSADARSPHDAAIDAAVTAAVAAMPWRLDR